MLGAIVGCGGEVKADSLTFHNLIFLNRRKSKNKIFDQRLILHQRIGRFVSEPGIDPVLLNRKKTAVLAGKHGLAWIPIRIFRAGAAGLLSQPAYSLPRKIPVVEPC